MIDNHIVAFEDGRWWGYENILPRERHAELFRAINGGATTWLHYTIRPSHNRGVQK